MRRAVEGELQRVVYHSCNPAYPEMVGMLAYHMGWEGEGAGKEAQGKRIRPLLTLLCADACGVDWHAALPAAAAVELLHNFSLIHDDIQDQSQLRRGRPTVWVKWGIAQAINAGDMLFTLAFLALQNLEETSSGAVALDASRILQKVCLRLTEGQYLDLSYEKRPDLTLADYWPMITGKTSALLGGCAALGALVGRADRDRREAFDEFGVKLGLAFQVLDDWLGIWGDEALTGKSAESDLISGKKSLPVLFGLAQENQFARRWRQGEIQVAEISQLVRLLEEDGAQSFTLSEADRLTKEARAALHRAVPEPERAKNLSDLTEQLLQRRY
jgi:geranylgeranyl diphosphate synthase type I